MKKYIPIVIFGALVSNSALAEKTTEEKTGNFFFGTHVNYLNTDDPVNNFGAGILAGYQFNGYISAYTGYRAHSGDNDDVGTLNNFFVGSEYHFTENYSVFAEVNSYNHLDTSVGVGAGYKRELVDNWSFVSKAGVDTNSDSFANIGVRYDFGAVRITSPVKSKLNERLEVPKKIIRFDLDIKFAHDSSEIISDYNSQFEELVSLLNKHRSVAITIEGHTSLIGSNKYNQALSERRANAVKEALIENYGIHPSRINAVGYGEDKPLITGGSPEAAKVNRRVVAEIKIYK